MSIVVTGGTPIPTSFEVLPGSLALALPSPQIPILRSSQSEDAWCYAACAEMVVKFLQPQPIIFQCDIAGFVKNTTCCNTAPLICTDSGCTKEQIGEIFKKKFHINYEGSNSNPPAEIGRIFLNEIESEISATPPRPIEVVIDWDVGFGQSSHAVLIVGVNGDSVYIIDPLRGINYNGWQPYDFVRKGFGHGKWVRTWLKLRND